MRDSVALVAILAVASLPFAAPSGCAHLNSCSGHGTCDEANRICNCYDGFGSSTDTALYKAPDCSQRERPPLALMPDQAPFTGAIEPATVAIARPRYESNSSVWWLQWHGSTARC